MIDESRIKTLANHGFKIERDYVLYWMQAAQRTIHNEALEYALAQANDQQKPLVVLFCIDTGYPDARAEHFHFLIEGLKDVHAELSERGIKMIVAHGPFAETIKDYLGHSCLVVCDRGYLRHQVQARAAVAKASDVSVIQIETNVVVPVEEASDKREYAARTIRPKLMKRYKAFIKKLDQTHPKVDSKDLKIKSPVDLNLSSQAVMKSLGFSESEAHDKVSQKGGQNEAQKRLKSFIKNDLLDYDEKRAAILEENVSSLSAYLHFGMISPVQIIHDVLQAHTRNSEGVKSYIEELLVRRELAHNFVHYEKNYDSFSALPNWAQKTLAQHADDERKPKYTKSEFEAAKTHDEYWNASMECMKKQGYLHNSLRMYWGKKILEWASSPENAFRIAISLNNKYFLDGRDPNSFANILWCFGLHDRPWGERDIFGMVRYLSQNNVKKKLGGSDGLENFKQKYLT